jgi:hypothetical protein
MIQDLGSVYGLITFIGSVSDLASLCIFPVVQGSPRCDRMGWVARRLSGFTASRARRHGQPSRPSLRGRYVGSNIPTPLQGCEGIACGCTMIGVRLRQPAARWFPAVRTDVLRSSNTPGHQVSNKFRMTFTLPLLLNSVSKFLV